MDSIKLEKSVVQEVENVLSGNKKLTPKQRLLLLNKVGKILSKKEKEHIRKIKILDILKKNEKDLLKTVKTIQRQQKKLLLC